MISSSHIRWGILGCGRIARKFASDLARVPDAKLVAAGSRAIETAADFAREFGASGIHGSYEELASNPNVDIIYIATPHHLHHANTLLCLEHGKAVLCEKPFALSAIQASEMIACAKSRKLFLMEALWTKFIPHYNKLMEMVHNGDLGTIRSMQVRFGFKVDDNSPSRMLDPAMGGGTLMDIGIYNLFLALSVLGEPDDIEATMTPAATGVDEQCAVLLKYNSGALAQLFSSFSTFLPIQADINGDEGRVKLTNRFYEPSTTLEWYPGWENSRTIVPVEREPGAGYQYEIRHVHHCLQFGLTESPIMSHADTLTLLKWLDLIREKAGIRFSSPT